MKNFFHRHKLQFIFIISTIIFYKGIFNSFFQDDFIKIYLGWFDTFWDVSRIFNFKIHLEHPNIAYRPIADHFFGFLIFHILNLNPVLTHLILFLIHGLNIFLLWKFLEKLHINPKIRLLIVFLYATSSIHFGTLYWLSANYVLLGTFFLLLLLNLILRSHITKARQIIPLVLLIYMLMLLTNEGLFLFPMLFIGLSLLLKVPNFVKLLFATFFLSLLSLSFRLSISDFRQLPDYKIGDYKEIISTFIWYTYRVLNFPEGIRQVQPLLYNLITMCIMLNILVLIVGLIYFLRNLSEKSVSLVIFGSLWYIFFGIPFYILPKHISSYYIATAAIGFFLLEAIILEPLIQKKNLLNNLLFFIFCFSYLVISFINIYYYHQSHWIIWRANIAQKYIYKTLNLYPSLPTGSNILFDNTNVSTDELKIILYDDLALQIYYRDKTLYVNYGFSNLSDNNNFLVSDL